MHLHVKGRQEFGLPAPWHVTCEKLCMHPHYLDYTTKSQRMEFVITNLHFTAYTVRTTTHQQNRPPHKPYCTLPMCETEPRKGKGRKKSDARSSRGDWN